FFQVNFVSISRSRSFLDLSFDEVSSLLQRDTLNLDNEQQAYEAVDRWIWHDSERIQFGSRLLKSIRLSLLPSLFISNTVERAKWVRETEECADILKGFK
ncbi:hypothetical protein PMAYCL1PPCAC_33376, partial [Pristionchus mayeri]